MADILLRRQGTEVLATLLIGILACMPFPDRAHARGDVVPGSRYTSGRGVALGDAFLPLTDDGASALFYNPAGIAKLRTTQFEPLNIQMQGNKEFLTSPSLNMPRIMSLDSYASTLAKNPGDLHGASASIFPNVFSRGFAFGVLMNTELSAVDEGSTIRYRNKYQFIPTLGAGLRLASGVVRVGYSLQWVNQASGNVRVPDTSTTLGHNQQLAQGSGLSHNLGLALTFPVRYLPALNLVVRNALGTQFNSFTLMPLARNSSGTLPGEPMTFDASFSFQPRLGKGIITNVVTQLKDISNRSSTSVFMRSAAGVELSFRDHFFIRGGIGSGYPTAGIGFKRRTGEFSLSWYSDEIGTAFRSVRDQRIMMQFQVRSF